jgi:8-oxo-dGTP pyrophosphatase MutT (NUDIX family)
MRGNAALEERRSANSFDLHQMLYLYYGKLFKGFYMMKSLARQTDVSWLPKGSTLELVATSEMPPLHLCTSAYVLAFDGERLLMADLDRGIDVPGGHIDAGETPEDAMRREAKEETGATVGPATLFAVQKITLSGPKPDGYAYPYPESYQLMYFSTRVTPGTFTKDDDSRGAVFIDPSQAKDVPWIANNRALYDCAAALARQALRPQPGNKPK